MASRIGDKDHPMSHETTSKTTIYIHITTTMDGHQQEGRDKDSIYRNGFKKGLEETCKRENEFENN